MTTRKTYNVKRCHRLSSSCVLLRLIHAHTCAVLGSPQVSHQDKDKHPMSQNKSTSLQQPEGARGIQNAPPMLYEQVAKGPPEAQTCPLPTPPSRNKIPAFPAPLRSLREIHAKRKTHHASVKSVSTLTAATQSCLPKTSVAALYTP